MVGANERLVIPSLSGDLGAAAKENNLPLSGFFPRFSDSALRAQLRMTNLDNC